MRNRTPLSDPKQIWESKITEREQREAIEYATISLPWTFDRMHYGGKAQKSTNDRMVHIAEGVLAQSVLERELTKRGKKCDMDWTGYRESDIFDFKVNEKIYDVKTTVIYSEYSANWKRQEFTPELFIQNYDYPGPEWRRFFPVMVPMTQLTPERMKDSYIFGIAETKQDLRRRTPAFGDSGFWCAAPYGKAQIYFQDRKLIEAREKSKKGFVLKAKWERSQKVLSQERGSIRIIPIGEWNGDRQSVVEIILKPGEDGSSRVRYSALGCIRVDHPSELNPSDKIVIAAESNFDDMVTKPTNPLENINDPNFEWVLNSESFVNLKVPEDFKIYWIGHIPFSEFSAKFIKYPAYFIPTPKNPAVNSTGMATDKIVEKLNSLDKRRDKAIKEGKKIPWPSFAGLISGKKIKAGILISANRKFGPPLGAACYYYPPYALAESAIYVLPRDLYTMGSL